MNKRQTLSELLSTPEGRQKVHGEVQMTWVRVGVRDRHGLTVGGYKVFLKPEVRVRWPDAPGG